MSSKVRPINVQSKLFAMLQLRQLAQRSSVMNSLARRRFGADHGDFYIDPFMKHMGTAAFTTMWFWMFYRFKQDGDVMLVRFIGPIFF